MTKPNELPDGSMNRTTGLSTGSQRFEGLDALRAAAMLLGVMLHAAVPYTPTRMPDLLWAVHDPVPSAMCDFVFWSIHVFRLPVYFVLSGFFAELLFQKRGRRQFLQHRTQRLLIPYLFSIATIGVVTFGLFATGWYLTGRCTLEQIFNPLVFFTPDIQRNFFGPAHLWFLADLILLTAAFWLLRGDSGAGLTSEQKSGRSIPSAMVPFVFAFPTAMVLWGNVSPVVAFNNSFIPDPARLLYFGIYFSSGVMFCRHRIWFLEAIRYPGLHLLLALPCIVLSVAALRLEIADSCTLHQLFVGLSVCSAAWLSIFGCFGVFVHRWKSSSPVIQYLADSSYWVYLCHLPLTVFAQILLHRMMLPTNLKFLFVSTFTLAAGLSTYGLFVRNSIVGQILNGSRQKLPIKPNVAVPAPHLPVPIFQRTASASVAAAKSESWQ